MARALASESDMNFLAVKGPELLSKWLGESERSLASLFRRARMASPSIIFFDEIDAIAVKRGSNDSASSGRLLSQLLTELDGVGTDDSKRVIVVAATNRPDLLDNALVRPGRIDRKIYVGTPDFESRRQILQLALKHKSCTDDINIDALATETDGCSGAELVALCRDAALFALENDDINPQLSMAHLKKANLELKRQITKEMLCFYATYAKQAR
jgi:SpoVK/Ycf46/Vps4 family AAA+-type ATPase